MKNIGSGTILFKLIVLLVLSFCASFSTDQELHASNAVKVMDLKCEYATNPVGMDIQSPQLSWQLASEKRGVLQTAYQILVADSYENLAQNNGNIWNSEKVNSSQSTGISFGGPAELTSRTRYYWKVRIWDSGNVVSDWSEPAFFEMGLLNQSDWNADWVGFTPGWTGRVLYFKRTFSVTKEIQKARAYISGLGYYELFINGRKVGDHVLDPAVSDYSKRVYYVTYDVADFLEKENVLVATVGPGWYGMPKLRLQLELSFADGTNESITSTTIRNVTTGPLIRSGIYDGEYYDAREESTEIYSQAPAPFINKKWGYASIADAPGGKMVSQKLEPVKIVDTINPAVVKEPLPGIYVVDAGQNLAGWASLKVKGKRGTIITLKFAESLYEDGTVNQENLRTAKAEDTYIVKGDNEERWEPAFTYHGFRYIQVEGFPYPPKNEDIQIKVVRSSVNQVGKFRCSNDLLNRIHQMVLRTEASNLHSIPTDCPQRDERMGWLNDLTVRIEQALYNFDLSRFYSKFIDDISDTQEKDGSITCTAPYKYGARPADPVSASYLLLALKSYEFYGNKSIIIQHYKGLKAWVDFLYANTTDGIVNYSYYGDWSPPVEFGSTETGNSAVSRLTPGKLMSTGYLLHCSRILSKMADLLGNEKDKLYYQDLADKTTTAFNKTYWNEELRGYASNNQACNSFALYIGVVDKDKIPDVVKNLVTDVKSHGYHLTTGNLCTKYLLETLTENGYPEIAFKIATQETYPSWGYMLANGATTLWERWEYETGGEMNSHNHPMMGSVDSWFYKYILGILPDSNNPGFEKFTIRPFIFNDLNFAEGELNTVKGIIRSSWRKEAGFIHMDVTIPGNSTAMVYVPAKTMKSITESNHRTTKVDGMKFVKMEDGYAVFQIGSGTYYLKSAWNY
jgi:alpha-L-rhamnosidase